MRVLILTIVFLIVTQFGFIKAHVTKKNEQSINDELKQHRQNRFFILPGSVHGNGTNWSPLGSLMDKWNQLIDWKISKINSIKSLMCNLILKGAFNCATKDVPANKQSIFDHFLDKFKMPQSTTTTTTTTTTTIKPDQQSTTNKDNQETTTTQQATSTTGKPTTNRSTPPSTSTRIPTTTPRPTSTSTAPTTSQSTSQPPSSSTTTRTTTTTPTRIPTSTSQRTSPSSSSSPSSTTTTTTPSSLPEDTSSSLNEI